MIGVGILLLRSDGTFLVGHRIRAGETPSWCLPGGKVEAGESFEKAALRELAEESGLESARDPRVFAVVLDLEKSAAHVTAGVVAHAGDAEAIVTEPDVFERWIWAPIENPPQPLFPASAALLAAYRGTSLPRWSSYILAAS